MTGQGQMNVCSKLVSPELIVTKDLSRMARARMLRCDLGPWHSLYAFLNVYACSALNLPL